MRIEKLSVAIAAAFFAFSVQQLYAQGVTVEDVIAAPAGNVAEACIFLEQMLEQNIPFAEAGTEVHTNDGTITKDNAAEYRTMYEAYLAVTLEAIEHRGWIDVAGSYTATATESCERIGSTLGGLVLEAEDAAIGITQDEYRVVLELTVPGDDDPLSVTFPGVVVEDMFLVSDPMYQNYRYLSVRHDDGHLVVRPTPGILAYWPEWARPPEEQDILDCALTLTTVN